MSHYIVCTVGKQVVERFWCVLLVRVCFHHTEPDPNTMMVIESYSFVLSSDQKYNLPDCTSDLMKARNVDHLCYLYINLKSAQMYLPSPTKLYYGISSLERELTTGKPVWASGSPWHFCVQGHHVVNAIRWALGITDESTTLNAKSVRLIPYPDAVGHSHGCIQQI